LRLPVRARAIRRIRRLPDGGAGPCHELCGRDEGGGLDSCDCEVPDRHRRPASAETLFTFIDKVSAAGCEIFTVHARKAWLKGLSPKENRDIPPLDYDLVAELKAARPDLKIILNGGIPDIAACTEHLKRFDGVMLGRAAYQTPALLGAVDAMLFGEGEVCSPFEALEAYRPYMAARLEEGVGLHGMTRHMLGLFNGRPGARLWRRTLSERAPRPGAGLEVLDAALEAVRDRAPV
jgi:tRNA-dihydrouridine synthase A